MRELALFAGAGGGILGGKLLGWRTVCAVEIDGYARSVLMARQNDGILEPFPIWDDVRTFDGKRWRGIVDVVSGGFPCQDLSIGAAMWGRKGINGKRSGLIWHMLRIIDEVRPQFVLGENSTELQNKGLDQIVGKFHEIGYRTRSAIIGADAVGLRHRRNRLWFFADTDSEGLERHTGDGVVQERRENEDRSPAHAFVFLCPFCRYPMETNDKYGWPDCHGEGFESRNQGAGILPRITGMADGVANRVDRLKTIGNGQVPAVVRLAWETLKKRSWEKSQ